MPIGKMSSDSGKPDLGKASSSSNRSAGFMKTNQNDLKQELKRIELSKRQYELAFSHEQRKIITKIANKLIRSSSNLEFIYNKKKPAVTATSQEMLPGVATTLSLSSRAESSHFNKSLRVERGHTYAAGFSPDTKATRATRPISSSHVTTSSKVVDLGGEKAAVKKNVKWNEPETSALSSNESSSSSKESSRASTSLSMKSRTSMYDLNKKYDELRLKYPDKEPQSILPQLIATNRRASNDLLNSRHTFDNILSENNRRMQEYRRKFKTMVEREDSGFYTYTDAKGQPVCLGYDNYGKLHDTRATSNVSRQEEDDLTDRMRVGMAYENELAGVDFLANGNFDRKRSRSSPSRIKKRVTRGREQIQSETPQSYSRKSWSER
jgi:hypothetical protein